MWLPPGRSRAFVFKGRARVDTLVRLCRKECKARFNAKFAMYAKYAMANKKEAFKAFSEKGFADLRSIVLAVPV